MKRRTMLSMAVAIGFAVAAGTAAASIFGVDISRRLDLVEKASLQTADHQPGDPVFIRIFKQESELELWSFDRGNNRWALAKTYPICSWSGTLGPKLKEGDGQSPEGFYEVSLGSLNPNSSYHLSFNIGFPNAFDRSLGRTGSYLMVHGSCVSIGCYAMTDAGIEEIYGAVEASLRSPSGQTRVPVHIFPFRFGAATAPEAPDETVSAFWKMLAAIEANFAKDRQPTDIYACGSRYALKGGNDCTPVSRVSLKEL